MSNKFNSPYEAFLVKSLEDSEASLNEIRAKLSLSDCPKKEHLQKLAVATKKAAQRIEMALLQYRAA